MAQYRAGRVTVVTDSDVVSGVDTGWSGNVAIGDIFLVRGEEIPYRVAVVIDDTTLRINGRYAGPTETNTTYSITRDFTPNLDLPVIHNGDVDAVPLFAEALILIDGKWGTAGGGGGTGAIALGDLSNVTVAGSIAGDQFTKLSNGTFGFIRPTPFTISFTDAPGDGARIFQGYGNGVVTARRIKAAGGTVTENADDITINIPNPGEVNTLASAGSTTSQSLVVAKSGTILRTKGLRAGANVTLTPEGNDLVIGATGGGGGTPITYTMAPTGNGVSLVAASSGTELRVRTIAFDGRFTTSTDAAGGLSVALNKLPISDISNVLWDSITTGQILTRNSAGNVVGTAMPVPGLASVAQDTAPRLGGPLDTAGQRIVGVPVTFSGMIARPKGKSYMICLSAPVAMRLDSITTSNGTGSLNFRIDVGGAPEQEVPTPSPIQGTASAIRQTTPASSGMLVDPTQAIVLTPSAISADIQDFTFTITGATV